jgi:hypothetical protein
MHDPTRYQGISRDERQARSNPLLNTICFFLVPLTLVADVAMYHLGESNDWPQLLYGWVVDIRTIGIQILLLFLTPIALLCSQTIAPQTRAAARWTLGGLGCSTVFSLCVLALLVAALSQVKGCC